MNDPALLQWLSTPDHAPARYLAARDLLEPHPSTATLANLRHAVLAWGPGSPSCPEWPQRGHILG